MQQNMQQGKQQPEEPEVSMTPSDGGAVPFFRKHRKLVWFGGGVIGALLLLILGLVASACILMSNIGHYHRHIEEAASKAVKRPVRFDHIQSYWQGLNPAVSLGHLTVSDESGKPQLTLESVDAVVSWQSLLAMEIRLACLQVNHPDLNIRRDVQGRFHIAGILIDPNDSKDNSFSEWLMKQSSVVVTDGKVHWQDDIRKGIALDIRDIAGSLENSGTDHDFTIRAKPDLPGTETLEMKGSFTMPSGKKEPDAVSVAIDRLDVDTLSALIPFLPVDDSLYRQLQGYQFAGKLADIAIEWHRQDASAWSVKGSFDNLVAREKAGARLTENSRLWPSGLGVVGLTGKVSANAQGGMLSLDSTQTALLLPAYPAGKPQTFDELKAELAWTQSETDGLVLDIQEMTFRQKAVTGRVSGQYTRNPASGNGGAGSLDLTAEVDNLAVADVKHYIPLQTPKALAEWLAAALKTGKVSKAIARIKGRIDRIPYPDGDGIFDVKAKLVDASMNYTPFNRSLDGKRPLWPDLDHIQGEFQMAGKAIAIHADSATTQGANLHDVDVVIPDTLNGPPTLEIKGYSDGPMKKQLEFVNASPVYEMIGHLTENTVASGDGSVDIKIHLPLKNLKETTVDGHLKFQGNDIILLEDLPVVTGTRGELHFTHQGFMLSDIKGRFLHEPVSIHGGTVKNDAFHVKAEGTLSGQGVRKTYTAGAMKHLAGTMTGHAPFTVDIEKGNIQISTDLKGIGLNLPAPLGKQAGTAIPLRVHLKDMPSKGTVKHDELSVSYGQGKTARYLRTKTGHDHYWRVAEGGFGINRPAITKEGLMVNADVRYFDLNEWIDFIVGFYASAGSSASGAKSSGGGLIQYLEPHWFNLKADTFDAFGIRARQAVAEGSRHHGRWEIDASADVLDGHIVYIENNAAYPHGYLQAKLKNFDVPWKSIKPHSGASGGTMAYRGPLPSMDVETENLGLLDRHDLGDAVLKAESVRRAHGNEWLIKQLHISNADAFIEATGKWTALPGQQPETQLDFQLDVSNEGNLLKRLLFDGLLKGGVAVYKGSIHWHGLPFVPDFGSMSGRMSSSHTNGQFLKIKLGAAKLLSVFSLQSLPRRAGMDFRDVAAKGFSYDSVAGDYVITDGIMKTDNLQVIGLPAEVDLKGIINIVEMTQDLVAEVRPEINAAGASIAVGLVNPIIGVGTFLAQALAREPLKQNFTYHYHITGEWGNPVVEIMDKEKPEPEKSGSADWKE